MSMSGSRKILLILILLLSFLMPLSAENFHVEEYSVRITADAAKKLSVDEDISLYFTTPSHGLIRDIQYDFGRTRIKIGDVHGTSIAEVDRSGDFLSVIMGDPNRYITGPADFSLGYTMQYPADEYDEYDELYYNIVSPGYWDSDMDIVSFSVTFPSPVDIDRIWVTYGDYGSSAGLPFNLSEDGLTVYGRYSSLPAGYGITLRVEMDGGYFYLAKDMPDGAWLIYAALGIIALAAAIAFAVYFLRGRDEKLIIPVRFTPPEGFSPMDTQYLIEGNLDSTAVAAMLIYWADKGYIRINDDGSSYSFDKLKELDEATEREKALFNAFFISEHTDSVTLRTYGFPDKLRRNVIPLAVRFFSGSNSIEEPSSLKARKAVFAMLLVAALFAGGLLAASADPMLLPFGIIPSFMAYMLLRSVSMQAARAGKLRASQVFAMLFFLAFIAFFMSVAIIAESATALAGPAVIAFIVILAVSMFLAAHISRRSRYGSERLAEALGYKEFIDKVEKDRIKALSEEDPEYFYHVLPYAMVFGLADSWADRFRDIPITEAKWYSSPYPFDPFIYSSFCRRWRDDYIHHIDPPRNTGGGGARTFSGSSGFSGGGFSGGGGRSW